MENPESDLINKMEASEFREKVKESTRNAFAELSIRLKNNADVLNQVEFGAANILADKIDQFIEKFADMNIGLRNSAEDVILNLVSMLRRAERCKEKQIPPDENCLQKLAETIDNLKIYIDLLQNHPRFAEGELESEDGYLGKNRAELRSDKTKYIQESAQLIEREEMKKAA